MTFRRFIVVSLAAASLVTGAASAQNKPKGPEAPTTPQAAKVEDPNIVAAYGLLLLLGGGMMTVSLLPSKRGHKD